MAFSPLTREALQKLYDGSEATRQKRIQETIRQIYTSAVAYATQVSTTSYTYKLSKYISTPQNNEEIIAGTKLLFPDSSVSLVDDEYYDAVLIDWSPQETELPEDESLPAAPSEEPSEGKPQV